MKIAIAATALGAALFLAPAAAADPTDTGVGNNPGLQQHCAFNPAFNKAHAAACADFDVEGAASNGGPSFDPGPDADHDGVPNGSDDHPRDPVRS